MKNRIWGGPYRSLYWLLILCNVIAVQVLWFKRARHSTLVLFIVAMFVNVGMWLERFVIIVTSLHRDFVPSSWGMYRPTIFDFSMLFGTIGMFLMLVFLFIRFLPVISIFEMRTILPQAAVDEEALES
jgi:molybdopterin-containing oxidoreductase family membrane subunit